MTKADVCLIREEPVLSSIKHQGDVSKVIYLLSELQLR